MKKTSLFLFLLILGTLPCVAKLDGGITKNTFYDVEKTIMPEVTTDTSIKTGKYWEKNLFYVNRYRPLFMLSNKELYSLAPESKTSSYYRVSAPVVYNISLKDSSVKKISLTPVVKKAPAKKNETKKAEVKQVSQKVAQKIEITIPAKTIEQSAVKTQNVNSDYMSSFIFEQAKNQGVDVDTKLETALSLKNTKKTSNYALALDLLDDVTRTEPFNASAYKLKAEIYLAKNDAKSAMQNYIEVLNLNPYSKESCLGIAKILEPTNKTLSQKYYDRANQSF